MDAIGVAALSLVPVFIYPLHFMVICDEKYHMFRRPLAGLALLYLSPILLRDFHKPPCTSTIQRLSPDAVHNVV